MKMMKKMLLLLIAAAMSVTLASCLVPDGPTGPGGGGNTNYIYGSDVDTQVVTQRDPDFDVATIVDTIESLCLILLPMNISRVSTRSL